MKLAPQTHYHLIDQGEHWWLKSQSDSDWQKLTPTKQLDIPRECRLDYWLIWQQASTERSISLNLTGTGAETELIGLVWATGKQEYRLNSIIHHQAAHTTGNCLVKAVVADQAKVSLSGMIRIDHQAEFSQDQLTERILMLSDRAWGELHPELEISTNEVVASHATTIAHLDPQELFYLLTRGLPAKQAENLLIQAFVQQIVHQLPDQAHQFLPDHLRQGI